MESRRLSNFDIERNIKSVSMKKLVWIWVPGFILYMTAIIYGSDTFPLLNRGTGHLFGLLLTVASVYFSIESTRIVLSAETFTINDELYLISDINSITAEQGRGAFMTSLVLKLINRNTVMLVCLTLNEVDEGKFTSLIGKLKVAKICSDRRRMGLE
jgi:hypothetical protein